MKDEKHVHHENIFWCWICRRPVCQREIKAGKHIGRHVFSPMQFESEEQLLLAKSMAEKISQDFRYGVAR